MGFSNVYIADIRQGWLLHYFLPNHLQIQAATILAKIESKKELSISIKNTPFLLPDWRKQRIDYNTFASTSIRLLRFHFISGIIHTGKRMRIKAK